MKDPAFEYIRDELLKGFFGCIQRYTKDCGVHQYQWPEEFRVEDFRMKKYDARKGLFSPHVDANNTHDNARYLVFFIYLNDGVEGGETTCIDKDCRVNPVLARVLMFPSTWTYPHTGEIPISSVKYIIGGYLHYGDK